MFCGRRLLCNKPGLNSREVRAAATGPAGVHLCGDWACERRENPILERKPGARP